jgi:DNA-binding response OmpR family regulator
VDRAPSIAKPKSILVVEDEFLLAMEMEALLTGQGFLVVGPAATVDGALELLKRHRPDAAVLDVNLRGMAVTPVARTLREMNIPFVVASAYRTSDMPADDLLREAVNLGKPIVPAALFATLRDLVCSVC